MMTAAPTASLSTKGVRTLVLKDAYLLDRTSLADVRNGPSHIREG